jgi:hypothetical protein
MTRSTKSRIVTTLVIVLVVGAVAGVFVYAVITQSRAHALAQPPYDDVMISYFQKHEEEFVELLEAYQTDTGLVDSELMERLGVRTIGPRLHHDSDVASGVAFLTSARYIFVHGWEKGYLYSEVPPGPLVGDISESHRPGCRHIEGDWYLYFSRF